VTDLIGGCEDEKLEKSGGEEKKGELSPFSQSAALKKVIISLVRSSSFISGRSSSEQRRTRRPERVAP